MPFFLRLVSDIFLNMSKMAIFTDKLSCGKSVDECAYGALGGGVAEGRGGGASSGVNR